MTESNSNRQKSAEERIQSIAEWWFLSEPLMFNIFCTHKIHKNDNISVPFRTGKMRIEYSPSQIDAISDGKLKEYLSAEIVRILLKHPYERVPDNANRTALGLASDLTIAQQIPFTIYMPTPSEFGLEKNLAYEEYYNKLKERPVAQHDYAQDNNEQDEDNNEQDEDNNEQGEGNKEQDEDNKEQSEGNKEQKPTLQEISFQKSELWQEDEFASEEINTQIIKAREENLWGSLGGTIKQMIEAGLVVAMDYKKILASFRASILSDRRERTRTRPNRRYGFEYMGSRYAFTTKLLVAVDVSGSVSDKSLSQFLSIINRFFKYGIKSIDVIQFDYEIKEEILSLKKAKKFVQILGRGGTAFQPPIDYFSAHTEYDGLIIFTDGYADPPQVKTRRRILWVLTDAGSYNGAKNWINNLPRNKAMWIREM